MTNPLAPLLAAGMLCLTAVPDDNAKPPLGDKREPAVNDPIAVELTKAKVAYRVALKSAGDKLVEALKTEDKKAEMNRSLTPEAYSKLSKQLENERKAFESDSTNLPMSPTTKIAVRDYRKAVEDAKTNCEKAFTTAANGYRGKNKDAMDAVLAEKEQFFKAGAVPDPRDKNKDYAQLATGTWKKLLPDAEEFKRLRERKAFYGTEPTLRSDVLICDKSLVSFPQHKAQDAVVRAQVRKPNYVKGTNLALTLRVFNYKGKGEYFVSAWCNGDGNYGIGHRADNQWKDLVTWKGAARGDYFEFAFAAVGNQLTAYVDGRQILKTTHDSQVKGTGIIIGGLGEFRDIEYQQLDK